MVVSFWGGYTFCTDTEVFALEESFAEQNINIESPPVLRSPHRLAYGGYCTLDNGYNIVDYGSHTNYDKPASPNAFHNSPIGYTRTYNDSSVSHICPKIKNYVREGVMYQNQINYLNREGRNISFEFSKDMLYALENNNGYTMNNDTYSGTIPGFEGCGAKRVGNGRILFKIVKYNAYGEALSPEYISFENVSDTMSLPVYIYEECDVYVAYVYELKELAPNIFKPHVYHNVRIDLEFKIRNNSQNLYALDLQTHSGLTEKDGNIGYTKNGFTLSTAGNKFYSIDISLNDGSFNHYTLRTLSSYEFNSSGKYIIRYKNGFPDDNYKYQTVYVDKQAPTAYINGNNLMNYSNMDGKYLAFTGTPTVTWDTSAYTAPITATYQKDNGTVQTLSNGQVLTKGTYKITLSKPTGLETVYYVKVDDYIPNKNYLLLKDNETYKSMLNRYQTKLWAVNVGTEVRGFGDYDVALEAAYDYEWSLVSQNSDGTLSYRTQTYSTNEALTLAMEPYAKANVQRTYYNIETPNLSLTENAYDGQILYLNGFKFIYNENAVFSQEVRYYKLSDLETTIDENVKLKARNGNILPYNTLVDTILSTSGRYVIYEKNILEMNFSLRLILLKQTLQQH